MRRLLELLGILSLVGLVVGGVLLAMFLRQGVSARRDPSAIEAYVARRLRHLAIPAGARGQKNPVPRTEEVLADARAHFADHCAICHANDGSGDTDVGRNLYPPAPDMRKEATQSLSDGELFWIIRNGVRFTGMPAWGSGDPEDDESSWELVHLIRHLPDLTESELAEMRRLNPGSVGHGGHAHGEGDPGGHEYDDRQDDEASGGGHSHEGPSGSREPEGHDHDHAQEVHDDEGHRAHEHGEDGH